GAARARPLESAQSIGALVDAFRADPRPRRRALGEATRADYRSKLKRLLETIAAAQRTSVETLRAQPVALLLQPAPGSGRPFLLAEAYEMLIDEAGEHMAHGTLAVASAWLSWVQKKKNLLPVNPAMSVARSTPEGRIVVFDWPEVVDLVRAAEALGLASIGDAVVLAVDLSWSQQDLLALTWGQVGKEGHVRHRRIKTGVAGNPMLLAVGRERMAAVKARWTGAKVQPAHVLICEETGRPWRSRLFQEAFAHVRAWAAAERPSLASKQFRDLRDTAVTYAQEAGLTVEEICSRTLHDPKRAADVIRKHYGALRQDLADKAAHTLDAHFAAKGYTFETPKRARKGRPTSTPEKAR
ncbi:MAG: hypothetical protein ACREEW_09740, partial [Caulobacteraceae bacterium]